jgi:hypothetical protein
MRYLILNYELYNITNAAAMYTILSIEMQMLRLVEEVNRINTNIFRSLEINHSQIYHDMRIEYSTRTDNQLIISN